MLQYNEPAPPLVPRSIPRLPQYLVRLPRLAGFRRVGRPVILARRTFLLRAACVALLAALAPISTGLGASAEVFAWCPMGLAPRFTGSLAALSAALDGTMGEPLECEHRDTGSSDLVQQTSTGLALYRGLEGVPTFASGPRRWALQGDRVRFWQGAELDVPPDAAVLGGGAPLIPGSAASALLAGPPVYPLNGRFLVANMHGFLFNENRRDVEENVTYARWLGAGTIRVFGTDNNTLKQWDGRRVGRQIVDAAAVLRANGVKLVVAFVNNHRPVPGETAESWGWLVDYDQLLLPFYERTWRGAYLTFVRDLITTVRQAGALDVVQAWELGNELHTPTNPTTFVSFVEGAVAEVRALDPVTPIYPGTMGANHLQPWNPRSPVARWLYCEAPVDAYTLHAYDWVSRERQGDMPIEWDLDWVTAAPCPSGRRLPVIVEELGASRALPGVYSRDDEAGRVQQELRQMRFVLGYSQVAGLGAWSAESPRVADKTFYDSRRGLTSFGRNGMGGGSCYDPAPDPAPGARCQLERALQALPQGP
ncbi:MAG: hypothetical protein HYX52_05900 [Chloroflexi bacterium]|nr:hypothetical protein [Chloroflexota bacterium]